MLKLRKLFCVFVALSGTLASSAVQADEPLKYTFKGASNPIYQIMVRAEMGDTVSTQTGYVAYTINKVEPANGQITMSFSESFRSDHGTVDHNNFDTPTFPDVPQTPGPGSPTMLLGPTGKVIRATRVDSGSQLPFLLGPSWQLMIPVFSTDNPRRWEENVQLTTFELVPRAQPQPQPQQPYHGPPWMRPPQPAPVPAERVERTAQSHTVYRVEKADGNQVTISCTNDLASDEKVGDQPLMKETSDGTYVFNRATGLVESFELKMTTEVNEKNITLKIPIKVSARLLKPEEVARIEEDRRKAQAKAAAASERLRAEIAEKEKARALKEPPAAVAVEQVKKAQAKWQATTGKPVDVLAQMKGDCARDSDGTVLLTHGQRIETPISYKVPTTIRMIIMTNENDVRIAYCADQMIFNWEMRPDEFRIDGGPASGKHRPGAGKLPANQYVGVEFVITAKELVIYVAGKEYYRQAADFSSINKPVRITAENESMRIKSVQIINGEP